MKIFLFPRQVGRGDGELGDKVAKESEEEGDLIVGDQRLENKDGYFPFNDGSDDTMMIFEVISRMLMAYFKQRGVQQPALQVPPGSALVTKELQVLCFSRSCFQTLSESRDGWSRWTTTQCSPPTASRCSSTSWRWRRRRELRWRRRSFASTKRILFLGLRTRNHIGCPIKKIPNVPFLEPSIQYYTLINQGGL